MSMHTLIDGLRNLLGIVKSMETLAARLGPAPDHEAIALFVRSRAELVGRMAGAASELRLIDPRWQETVASDTHLAELAAEVQNRASAVIEYDRGLAHLLKKRMSQVKNQLRNLSTNSRAALGYAAQNY